MATRLFGVFLLALLTSMTPARRAAAHCDTTRGPVVTAARAALASGNVDLVLHWVPPEDESVIRSAFEQTMKVRALGPSASELADRYFFEMLVRIHRASEGAAYTGLTDGEPEPMIAATDRALERGSTAELERQLITAVQAGLAERFATARAARDFRPGDVAAGRVFVAAYVPLTHWVEGVFSAAEGASVRHAAVGHDETAHAGPHALVGDTEPPAIETHDRGALQHLPWILTGVLALAALVEGMFLLRRGRPAVAH
jgi:hypothetical protein